MLAKGPFWSSRVRTCSHGTAPAGGGTLMFIGGSLLSAPSPRRGGGRCEGLSEFQLKDRAPLTRLASLATLSPSGRGEDIDQSLQVPMVTRPPASSSASPASLRSMTSSTAGFLAASMSPWATSLSFCHG